MQFSRIYFVIILTCEWHWSTLSNLQYKFVCGCVYILVRILVKLHQQHRAFQCACAIFLPNFTSRVEFYITLWKYSKTEFTKWNFHVCVEFYSFLVLFHSLCNFTFRMIGILLPIIHNGILHGFFLQCMKIAEESTRY